MATLKDIAKRAGCSVATASRALGANGFVSDAACRRVRRAAAELGYLSAPAVAGQPGLRRVVGVLIPSVTNPVFAASLSSIQNRMQVSGYSTLIVQSNYDPAQEAHAISALLAERPAGLILTLCDAERINRDGLRLPPAVLLNNRPTASFPAAVTVDNFEAGRALARYVVSCCHRRVLFVSGHFKASDRARLRYEGYLEVMNEAGAVAMPPLEIPFIGSYEQLDLSAVLGKAPPTAIIASNDLLAFGVIGALRRQGLSVPGDISVAGFDGIAVGQLMAPPLSTVEMPDATMGAVAASLLLDMAENGVAPRHLEIGFSLRAGATVRSL